MRNVKATSLLTCSEPEALWPHTVGRATCRAWPGPSYLTLVQPSVLDSVVQLAQLLVGIAHVFVPQPSFTLRRYVEQLPHFLLDGRWKQAETSLRASRRGKAKDSSGKLRLTLLPCQMVMGCFGSKVLTDLSPLMTPKADISHGHPLALIHPETFPMLLLL